MKKWSLLALVVIAAFAACLPAFATAPASDTTAPAVISANADAPSALPAMCTSDTAASPNPDKLEVLLDVAPADSESCYPPECPCPAGVRCWAKCCLY